MINREQGKRAGKDIVEAFNADVTRNRGYLYTTNARLSSQYANERMTAAALAAWDVRHARLLEIGCGDGTYTIEIFDRGHPRSITAIDPSEKAIQIAEQKKGVRVIEFFSKSAYNLPWESNAFDVAYIRGVLHHMERPLDALREALRLAPIVVVLEPNGYNPALKVLEKLSPYHVEHAEKSFPPHRLDEWVAALGGAVTKRQWIGLVPMFCPDWLARVCKALEPLVENTPMLNRFCCAQYIFVARPERNQNNIA